MFGGRFKQSVPDTQASIPLTERDTRKQRLKDEISKCMQQLELDENNNPNNATSVTIKSESHRPPVASRLQNNNLLLNAARNSTSDGGFSAQNDNDTTSMTNLLMKYQQKRTSSNNSRQGLSGSVAHTAYLNQMFSNNNSYSNAPPY